MNTRIMSASPAGVARHAREIKDRLSLDFLEIAPAVGGRGIRGHVWEQTVLPMKVGQRLLWSPGNTGPISVRNQVVTIHDMFALDHPEWFSFGFANWYRWLMPQLARRVRKIVAVSNYTKERIIEMTGVSDAKIQVIYNGVDRSFRPCEPEDIAKVKEESRIPYGRYFVVLSTIEPRKNIGRILQAWANIVDKLPDDVGLVLLGATGPARVFRDTGIDRNVKRVHFAGRVDDEALAPLLSGALGLVFVSLYEGFGIPAIEAMACGCPVITSNCSALPEVCGDAAAYVDSRDVEAIGASIQELADNQDESRRLRSAGLVRARKYSWDESAAKYSVMFKELI